MLIGTNLLFIFFAWLAYPETFQVLVGLMVIFTITVSVLAIFLTIHKEKAMEDAFHEFLLEPTEINEERLCKVSPRMTWPYIWEMGKVFRSYEEQLNDRTLELADYENYIEGWVHEVKKPLSLMTLVLDNRRDEMSPLVRKRMVHVRDTMHRDVERILYFARLKAVHKDYLFESINLLAFCKETVTDYQSILEESNFQVEFHGQDVEVVSDRKGLAFIVGQIIDNSVKHVKQSQEQPVLRFETVRENDAILLIVSDNGPGVSREDLPFIFDKGFTGKRGSLTKEATGMGLYLVHKMADDLAIELNVKSEIGKGFTLVLKFPKVK